MAKMGFLHTQTDQVLIEDETPILDEGRQIKLVTRNVDKDQNTYYVNICIWCIYIYNIYTYTYIHIHTLYFIPTGRAVGTLDI